MPVFLQQQRAECGLVSLAMIASFFDAEQTADGLRALAGGSQRGADLHMLMRLASKADLVARPVRLSIGELKRIQRQVGITFVCVTHHQEEALFMSDRVAVLHQGKVMQYRRADRVKLRFCGSLQDLISRRKERSSLQGNP